jgi:hypothetical protein
VQEKTITNITEVTAEGEHTRNSTQTVSSTTTTVTIDANGNVTSYASTSTTTTTYKRYYEDPCDPNHFVKVVDQTGDNSMDGTTTMIQQGANADVWLAANGSDPLQDYVEAVSYYITCPLSKYDSPVTAAAEQSKKDASDVLLVGGIVVERSIEGPKGVFAGAVITAVGVANEMLIESEAKGAIIYYQTDKFGDVTIGMNDPMLNPTWWMNGKVQ